MSTRLQYPECAICFETLCEDLSAPIKCGHVFHTQCLKYWCQQNRSSQCPLCRQDATNIVHLMYDIKAVLPGLNEGNSQGQKILNVQELGEENRRLEEEKKILLEHKREMTQNYQSLIEELKSTIKRIESLEKREEDHKRMVLSQGLKIREKDDEISKLKEKINKKNEKIQDLEKIKRDYALIKQIDNADKLMDDLMETDEDLDIKEKFLKMMNESEGVQKLSEHFFIFQTKIKNLEQENQDLKKQLADYKRPVNEVPNYLKINNLGTGHEKRKFNDSKSQRGFEMESDKKSTQANTTRISFVNDDEVDQDLLNSLDNNLFLSPNKKDNAPKKKFTVNANKNQPATMNQAPKHFGLNKGCAKVMPSFLKNK
ncbi:MAG: hypothetical protein MJ252_03570 [archaeon]|nr:hypothetical protein [archaeon]